MFGTRESSEEARRMSLGSLGTVLLMFFVWMLLSGCVDNSSQAGATAASRCLAVPASMVQVLTDGLTVRGGGTISSTAAVRSRAFENMYFIAAEIDGPGLERTGDVGVWASNRLEGGQGLVLAVNGIANEFSVWPSGSDSSSNIKMSDDGARQAQACL
jgi:hypothetical protein